MVGPGGTLWETSSNEERADIQILVHDFDVYTDLNYSTGKDSSNIEQFTIQ